MAGSRCSAAQCVAPDDEAVNDSSGSRVYLVWEATGDREEPAA